MPSHLGVVAVGAAALLALYSIGSIVYNLYFHPLRHYPGPKLTAATKWPYVLARARGLVPRLAYKLHEQYGDVVRISPGELSYISAEAWRDIYGHKIQGRGGLPKNLSFYGPDITGTNGIIRANDADHARQRRLLAHAFSDKALREQEPLIRKYVDLLMEKLQDVARTPSSPVDMVRYLNCCTFDIMGDLAFGEPLGLLERSSYTPWVAAIFSSIKSSSFLSLISQNFPLFATLIKKFFLSKALMARRKVHIENTLVRVDKRLARKTDRPDIWTFVLRHNDEKGMQLNEMHSNGSTLMIAGTETTATLLSGLTYLLLQNKHVLDKLAAEIRTTFADPSEIDMTTLGRCEYLQACLDETLRIYPPVPIGLPRVVPPGGRVICGKPVPGGTIVAFAQWASYHNPANFHEPDSFLPERWLPNPEPRFATDERGVLEPFSYGPRNCIGKNLAFHEMRLIAANLLWHFDMQMMDESRMWMDQKAYTIWEKPPLMVKVLPAVRA